MTELEKAVLVEPSMSLVHLDLGILYAEAKRNDEAERELLKAIELDPKSVAPHWRLAKLYQTMGKKDQAKAEFAKAASMNKEASQELSREDCGGGGETRLAATSDSACLPVMWSYSIARELRVETQWRGE